MSFDDKLFTHMLLQYHCAKPSSRKRFSSRRQYNQSVPLLGEQLKTKSFFPTAYQTRINSPDKRRRLIPTTPLKSHSSMLHSAPALPSPPNPPKPKSSHRMLRPLQLRAILTQCTRYYRPTNCSLSRSVTFLERQMNLFKTKTEKLEFVPTPTSSGTRREEFDQILEERSKQEESDKIKVISDLTKEHRKKLQRAINKREKAKARCYTIT